MTSFAPAVLAITVAVLPQSREGGGGALRAEAAVLLEGMATLDGGLGRETAGLYLVRGSLVLDGREIGARGLRANLTGLATGGATPGTLVGDAQGVSNIAAPDGIWPYEAWVQQNVGARLSVLAGIYDVNSEFDALDVAGLFLHSSFGIGADFGLSGANGPSTFPATGLAVRLAAAPRPDLRVRVVAADGTPGDPSDPGHVDPGWRSGDGVLLAGEVVHRFGDAGDSGYDEAAPQGGRRFLGRGSLSHRSPWVGAGAWRYAGVRPGPLGSRAQGAYVLAEGRLAGPRGAGTGPGLFGRAGIAEGSPVRGYVGAGVTATGPVRTRPGDEVGLGVAVAWPDPAYLEAVGLPPGSGAEAVVELSYRATLAGGVFIQPDLQYVANPLLAPGAGRAVVAIIRLGLIR